MAGNVTPFSRERVDPPMPETVESLLQRVARGDEQAFAVVYDRMAPGVFGIARRVVRDPSQAEEVAQEVLLEVWRKAPQFDPSRASAQAWVFTIAHRRAVDRVRNVRATAERDERDASTSATPAFDEVYESVASRLEVEQIRRALDSLTDIQRAAIELAYYDGYTQQQVADVLRVPLGTAKTRLRDGLIRLRDAMGVTT
jgi:RNA polymerase sigma-70 factor, ECF subfamily